MMKMGRPCGIPWSRRRVTGRRPLINGATSPRVSLARASPRTRYCCPRTPGEHAEQNVSLATSPGARLRRRNAMDTLYAKVAGLDVHQKFITVGVRCRLETGKTFAEVRTFGTMTRDLRAMADYLEAL